MQMAEYHKSDQTYHIQHQKLIETT